MFEGPIQRGATEVVHHHARLAANFTAHGNPALGQGHPGHGTVLVYQGIGIAAAVHGFGHPAGHRLHRYRAGFITPSGSSCTTVLRKGTGLKMISQEQGDSEYQTGLEIFLSHACIHKVFLDNYFYWGCLACGNMGSSAGQHNNQYVFFSTVAHNKRNSCQSSPVKGYWLAYGKIGKNTHKYGEDCNTCYNVDFLQAHSSLRSMEGYINFSSFYSAN